MVILSQLPAGQLHGVQHHAGRGITDSVQVQIQPFLIQLLYNFSEFLCGE
jgi:hypothetical protein